MTQQNSVKSLNDYFNAGEAKRKQKAQKDTAQDNQAEPEKQAEKAKKPVTAKDKKRQSQAAILQMAQQAAKRAEEKAKKKSQQPPQARTKGETRRIDTRVNSVDLENIIRNMRISRLLLQWVITRKSRSSIKNQSSTEKRNLRAFMLIPKGNRAAAPCPYQGTA